MYAYRFLYTNIHTFQISHSQETLKYFLKRHPIIGLQYWFRKDIAFFLQLQKTRATTQGLTYRNGGPGQNHYLGALFHPTVFEDINEKGLIPHM